MTTSATAVPSRALAVLAGLVRRGLRAPWAGGPASKSPSAATWTTVTEVRTAGAPFAASSYARARLLRQMHAGGLLAAPLPRRPGDLLADADPSAEPDRRV